MSLFWTLPLAIQFLQPTVGRVTVPFFCREWRSWSPCEHHVKIMSKSPSQIEGSLKKQVGLHVFCANHPEFLALGYWMVRYCFNFYKLFTIFFNREIMSGAITDENRQELQLPSVDLDTFRVLVNDRSCLGISMIMNVRNTAHQLLVRSFLDRESEWIRCVLTKPNWGIRSSEMNKIISAEFRSENPQVLSASTAKILPYPSCWPGGFRGYGLGGNPSLDKLYLIYIARLQRCTCIICYHLAWRC